MGIPPAGCRKVLGGDREVLATELLAICRTIRSGPFSADTFWKLHRSTFKKENIQQLLNYLFSQKKLVRLNDQRFLSLEPPRKSRGGGKSH